MSDAAPRRETPPALWAALALGAGLLAGALVALPDFAAAAAAIVVPVRPQKTLSSRPA